MNGGLYYGYDFRSTQPCTRHRFPLPLSRLGDLASVDAWLTDRFHVDRENLAAIQAKPQTSPRAVARGVIERALLIYGELAQLANFPCFDLGRLIRLEAAPDDDGTLIATVALPVTDNVSKTVFAGLFNEALEAVLSASKIPASSDPNDQVIARLEKAIDHYKATSPFRGTSTIPVCRVAHRHGLPFRHLGGGYMRLGTGSGGRLVHKASLQRDSAIGAIICHDKHSTARVLRAAGLPGAEHIPVRSPEAARAAAEQLGWPVVVKPADREQSQGVTTGVSDEAALLAAYDKAQGVSRNVLVERQVAGDCHRILVAGGKVLYVVKRMPKRVRGNGRDSVTALVDAANAWVATLPPWKRLKPFVIDDLALESLAADGFTPSSVPEEGQFAYLRPLAKLEWGGAIEDLTRQIHPANAELAIGAARLLGLTMAGVDFITTDIAQPWHVTGSIINEMNFRPQLMLEGREIDASILSAALADGGGRIPVHLVTGNGNLDSAARKLKLKLSKAGRGCHSTSSTHTHGPDGSDVHIAASTLFERSLALTMRPEVRELILIGPPDELFVQGLAVDRLESMQLIDADGERAERLLDQLQARFVVQSVSNSAA